MVTRIAVRRRRARRAVLRDADQAGRPGGRGDGLRAQPRRRHLRLRRGVLRRDPGRHPRRRSRAARRRCADARPALGRHRGPAQGRAASGAPATAWPRSPARPCSRCCRSGPRKSASTLRFGTEVRPGRPRRTSTWSSAADGANSRLRDQLADELGPTVETATAKFIWFGTDYLFDGLTFVHERGPHGVFAVHGYPISDELAPSSSKPTRRPGGGPGSTSSTSRQPPGPERPEDQGVPGEAVRRADRRPAAAGQQLPLGQLPHPPHPLAGTSGNVVLLGDAAHTAHFSVGSGTKMAMEDAIALADASLAHPDDLPTRPGGVRGGARALGREDPGRGPAEPVLVGALRPLPRRVRAAQFAFHFLSRSIGVDRLARRDPDFVAPGRRGLASARRTSRCDARWTLAACTCRVAP